MEATGIEPVAAESTSRLGPAQPPKGRHTRRGVPRSMDPPRVGTLHPKSLERLGVYFFCAQRQRVRSFSLGASSWGSHVTSMFAVHLESAGNRQPLQFVLVNLAAPSQTVHSVVNLRDSLLVSVHRLTDELSNFHDSLVGVFCDSVENGLGVLGVARTQRCFFTHARNSRTASRHCDRLRVTI